MAAAADIASSLCSLATECLAAALRGAGRAGSWSVCCVVRTSVADHSVCRYHPCRAVPTSSRLMTVCVWLMNTLARVRPPHCQLATGALSQYIIIEQATGALLGAVTRACMAVLLDVSSTNQHGQAA